MMRRFLKSVFIVAAVVAIHSPAISLADYQTYYYQGAPVDEFATCTGTYYSCPGGPMSGYAVLRMPADYSGGVNGNDIIYFALTQGGVGQVTNSDYSQGGQRAFYFENGQMYNWEADGLTNSAFIPPYTSMTTYAHGYPPTGSSNGGRTDSSGNWLVYGGSSQAIGEWTGSSVIGACDSPTAHPGGVGCTDPISVGTGNMYDHFTDYETAGQNKLSLIRYYNSYSLPNTYATRTGQNWRTNYDRYLHFVSADYVMAERQDGQLVSFFSSAGSWVTSPDIDLQLSSSGSNWLLTDPNDTIETYSSSGGIGVLSSIKLRNGYTQTLSYTSGNLSQASDSYGRTLGFTYSSSTGLLIGVSTPDTPALTYGYALFASAGTYKLTSVSYNTSPVTSQTYLYENTGYPYGLTGIIDENGNRYASWAYDGEGRGVMSEHALGADHTEITYDDTDPLANTRVVTGPLGIQETYKFTYLQGAPKITEIDRAANGTVAAATRLFTYDSNGFLANSTDWDGNDTSYVNNTYGLPTTIVFASTSAVAETTDITYDSTFVRLPKTITTADSITTLSYDSSGNVLTRAVEDQASQSVPYFTSGTVRNWTYTWTGTGQLLTAQLPRTDVTAKTTLTYSSGTLTSIADALSHTTNILTYTSGGYPLTVTDPNSVLTTLSYNPRMWLTSSVLTLSSGGTLTTSLQYDSAGNLTKYTLPDNSYRSYGYDDAHRLTSITDPLSESQIITYNSAGGITQTLWKDASSNTVRQHTATFDALNRLYTDVGGVSQTTTYGYDDQGNVTSITDPLGSVTTLTYDSANRLSTSTDPLTNLTSYTYDAHDRVLSVTDPRSKVTNYVYDGFGERIQTASPDTGTTVLHFDSDGNVSSQTDANTFVTNATYDALDRILTRTYPADSSLNVSMTYDSAGHGKGIGRLTSLTDQAGSLSLTYEERGLITANNRTIGSNAYNTGFAYQSAGRLATLTYASSGWAVGYAYDSVGQVTTVTDKPPSTSAVNLATSVTHMPFGPVKSFTYGNGITDARVFDLDYRTMAIKDLNGATSIYYSSFGYNANDNVTSITDNVASAQNQTLTYDSANWLKFASGSYGTSGLTLTYDSSGNRSAYGSTSYTISGTSNRVTAIGATSLTYTSSGNITAIGTTPTFTYNKANQMATAVLSGTTSAYLYDAFGNRLSTVVGTTRSNIQSYGLNREVLTEANGGVKTDYAYLDGFPVAAIQPAASTVSGIHTNYLGTPQKATNSAKTVVWTGNYDPNGAVTPTASITMNLRFPGQYADATGAYHNGFRNYVPKFGSAGGRYLESDPIGLAGGLNTYAYVDNNPYGYVDPSGLVNPLEVLAGAVVVDATVIAAADELSAGTAGVRAILAARTAGTAEAVTTTAVGGITTGGFPTIEPATAPGAQCTVARPAGQLTYNFTSSPQTADQILERALEELGSGYKEVFPGIYRSDAGLGPVQFRMTPRDLTPQDPHVHFEYFEPGVRLPYENDHVPLLEDQ